MSKQIKTLTQDTFDEAIREGVTLVDFYAEWCGPCRMMSPVLELVAQQMHSSVAIAKLDIDYAQEMASTYQVTSVPTLILFKEGKEIGRIVGLRDKEAIVRFIQATAQLPV